MKTLSLKERMLIESGFTPPVKKSDAKDVPDTKESVGILVVKDGQILCGIRDHTSSPGMVCGPGGHVKKDETYWDAAIRETEEEFGITPTDLEMIGFGPKEEKTGMSPALFLCTEYASKPDPSSTEMKFARFMGPDQIYALIAAGVVFRPFADSMDILMDVVVNGKEPVENDKFDPNRNNALDNDNQKVIIKLPHPQYKDGGSGSGNHEHKGVPGQVGGSAPGPGSVSAEGENVPCTGFASPSKLRSHAARHGQEFGITSKKEYQQRGIDFLKQPCGGDVLGYSTSDGMVVRFNKVTTEYATGFPGSRLCTYMKAKCHKKTFEARPNNAMQYYLDNKAEDLGK